MVFFKKKICSFTQSLQSITFQNPGAVHPDCELQTNGRTEHHVSNIGLGTEMLQKCKVSDQFTLHFHICKTLYLS